MKKLADNEYWKGLYDKRHKLPIIVSPRDAAAFEELHELFERILSGRLSSDSRVLEVGCAPGGWLAYFHKQFGCRVDGLEYTRNGAALTKRNLAYQGIDGEIFEQDLFDNDLPAEAYDLVCSFGFIEHFDNPDKAVFEHLRLLKKGGILLLEIPNLKGMNHLLQKISKPEVLPIHNLSIMRTDFFRELGKKFNLRTIHIGYVGNFHPAVTAVRRFRYPIYGLQFLIDLAARTPLYRLLPRGSKWSPFIVGVYVKE